MRVRIPHLAPMWYTKKMSTDIEEGSLLAEILHAAHIHALRVDENFVGYWEIGFSNPTTYSPSSIKFARDKELIEFGLPNNKGHRQVFLRKL